MAQKKAAKKATENKAAGKKRASSGAGEYISEEMRELKKGKLKDEKQAIAIGLSRARRAGEDVPSPRKGTSPALKKKAKQDEAAGRKRAAAKKRPATKKKR